MDRRSFLALTALAVAATPILNPTQVASAASGRVLFELPKSSDRRVAWTVDDGFSKQTVDGYLSMLEANPNIKVTFFVTSAAAPWSHYSNRIRKLIDLGQVQVGNHTHTHAPLTHVRSSKVYDELSSCKKFLEDKFGVSGVPFYRPPYGYYDDRVRSIAAELGYTDTVMWYGTLADAGKNTRSGIFNNAYKWMQNGRIVIGHANYPQIINDFPSIISLLNKRGLSTVTLAEAFA